MSDPLREIIYVGDPMCSWCWGFSPAINGLAQRFGDRAPVRMVVGGLRPGTTEPMDEAQRDFIRGHWQHVVEASGQPFDFAALDKRAEDGFVYDTEPAAKAVVVVRNLKPDAALAYFDAVQEAFYAEGRNVTRIDELARLAEPFDIGFETFTAEFQGEDAHKATWGDFAYARHLGANGFPTLLVRDDTRAATVAAGYRDLESLIGPIEHWLEHGLQAA
jgi:putative protein-disulfide isomerase